MFRKEFRFGSSGAVRCTDLYQPETGFGFVIEKNRREVEALKIAELNSAFAPIFWYQDADLTTLSEDASGCCIDSDALIAKLEAEAGERIPGEHRYLPLIFKTDVPKQGNYLVTLIIRAPEEMKNVLIFTGRRRLAFRGDIPAGTFTLTMMVNICDIIPRGYTEVYTDTSLDITILADKPRISELTVEEAVCPTIYIAGDSTVTDQSANYPYASGTTFSGWGQMLSAFTDEKIAVSNHAHSGLTTNSFRNEGHHAITRQYMQPKDYMLFQFAHNDQKLQELKAWEGYRDNLIRYIEECREKEVYPILVTPLARNTWKGNEGVYNDFLAEYAEVCIEVGKTYDVPVLDLHQLSVAFILEKGLEPAKAYFYPGDYTHTNEFGAYLMAKHIADEILRVCADHHEPAYRLLAEHITGGYGNWEAPKNIVPYQQPAAFKHIENPFLKMMAKMQQVERPDEPALRVDAMDMVTKAMRFFLANVYNDMFTDVVGHEWYAGVVECAYQNDMIHPGMVEDGKVFPLKPVTLEEMIVFAMSGYRCRKNFPEEVPCAYDDRCREFARPFVRAACAIGLLPEDGSEDLQRGLTRGEAASLCRKMGV